MRVNPAVTKPPDPGLAPEPASGMMTALSRERAVGPLLRPDGPALESVMAEAVSRNAPCPCGSGEKYKRCCIDAPGGAEGQRGATLLVVMVVVGLLVGGFVAIQKDLELGLAAAGGIIVLAGIIHAFRSPPPPRSNTKDPASMNFGN